MSVCVCVLTSEKFLEALASAVDGNWLQYNTVTESELWAIDIELAYLLTRVCRARSYIN